MPPLVFGEARASITNSAKTAAERAAKTITTLDSYEPLTNGGEFQQKSAAVCINGLDLVAFSSTPIRVGVGETNNFQLIVPFYGRSVSVIGNRSHQWNANENAILFGECASRQGVSETRSILVIGLDRHRLLGAARAMLGEDDFDNQLDGVDGARLIPLRYGSTNFTLVCRQICQLIDSLSLNVTLLEKIGIDDLIYRQLVCLLNPELVIFDSERSIGSDSRSRVDVVCEAIRNSRDKPLTLTEMERAGGLSRRVLQSAFKKRFGCSPMAWQRDDRLRIARDKLVGGGERVSITQLSLELGFSSPSSFAAFYRRAYGETPTESLLRSRKNMKKPR